jgi:hypothetical protein
LTPAVREGVQYFLQSGFSVFYATRVMCIPPSNTELHHVETRLCSGSVRRLGGGGGALVITAKSSLNPNLLVAYPDTWLCLLESHV